MADPSPIGQVMADVMTKTMKGKRIKLVRCTDPYTRLTPGSLGTVDFVDAMGTVHVNWDCGSFLGLVPGEDEFHVI
jgi:hypothetical protein